MNTKFGYTENMLNFYSQTVPDFSNEYIMNLNYETQNQNKSVSVCIVIPTYNEVQNIPKLLSGVYSKDQQVQYDKDNILMNVLIVDDSSPDGTADVVKEYQQNHPNVYLMSRTMKNGLGAAYIAGMQHAIKLLKPDIIFEMDGDLQHNPKYILPMIQKIREGADFVIGSRYVKGGSIPKNWGIKRMLISKSANLYTKTALRIKNVNDCTGGFRAIRTSALLQVDLSKLKTKGYGFQISLLEEMRRNDAIMSEVPIAFEDRTNGTSKMRLHDMLEEGLFVLKTSLENIFYPKKRTIKKKLEIQSLFLNEGIKPLLNAEQHEFIEAFGLIEEPQVEFNQMSIQGKEPLEVQAVSA